ncbi:hypothetical protein, partial, partial [Absidia glauca]
MTVPHEYHVPDDNEDRRTLPMAAAHIARIKEQLRYTRDCRSIGLSIIYQLETLTSSYRAPTYEDIYNQLLVVRVPGNDRLRNLRRSNPDFFAKGFQSPNQLQVMGRAESFSLDATHNVEHHIRTILYSWVVKHPITGRGYPVAYMITNSRGIGPLVQWLSFLRDNSGMAPRLMSVDCDDAERTAIT